ncbi:MAG: DUF488 family protein [Methanofollis sp.]|uniref:DUF488 domain-containing protein n=1 Tax=Methanofollis sp. TaxID=2052835 RepID=UPI002609E4D0|nr:DUF488 family protein [Methanofollis sp.]MDD4254910.1 DUF488 family protein [Methanofollis sp.]
MLRKNEKQLLYLISICGRTTRLRLVKTMFLISQRTRAYNFVPYRWGPYSFQMYHDLLHLEKEGYVYQEEKDVILRNCDFPHPDPYLERIIENYKDKVFTNENYIDEIYNNYPEYTILSEYKKLQDYERNETGMSTIGYEGKDIDQFLYDLVKNKITLVIDVRRNPFSMKYGFTMNKLVSYLEKMGIKYVHMPELGIGSEKRKDLKTEQDYKKLFMEYSTHLISKKEELEHLKKLSKKEKVALLCFEADPKKCHRGVIAEELRKGGIVVEDL